MCRSSKPDVSNTVFCVEICAIFNCKMWIFVRSERSWGSETASETISRRLWSILGSQTLWKHSPKLMLKNARFETSATNDASTALQILPSQKPGTKLMDIVFSRRRRVEAGAFSDLKKHTTFTKTHSRHIFTIKKSCKLRNPPKSLKSPKKSSKIDPSVYFRRLRRAFLLTPLVYSFPLNT